MEIAYADITGVQFYPLGDREIRSLAVVEVTKPDIIADGKPVNNGVMDIMMGSCDNVHPCGSCGHTKRLCPGHFGMIKLKTRVLSPFYIKSVIRYLKIICHRCGNIVMDVAPIAKRVPQSKILSELSKLYTKSAEGKVSSKRKCIHCGLVNPNVNKSKTRPLLYECTYDKPAYLYPCEIAEIFDRISDATLRSIGVSPEAHPRKFVLSCILCPPNSTRPIKFGSNDINDITALLQTIIGINDKLPIDADKNIKSISEETEANIYALQQAVYDLILAPKKASTQGIQHKPSIASGFPSKKGLIRDCLNGKRVFLCSRTFIICDPTMPIDTIGLPFEVARTILIPVVVRNYNWDECMQYFLNGNNYPGVEKIKLAGTDNMIIASKAETLHIGDTIYRHYTMKDIAPFNRQPSLEISSLTAMKNQPVHGNAYRMNVGSCDYFNADFDGDAMNFFFTKSEAIMQALKILSSASCFFISAKDGKPKVGQVLDGIYGLSEMTQDGIQINRLNAMMMFCGTRLYPNFATLPEKFTRDMISGRDLISLLFHIMNYKINYSGRASSYVASHATHYVLSPSEINVSMKNGVLESGIIDKSSVGSGTQGGINHIINNRYGPDEALRLIFIMQQIAISYNSYNGATMTISDIKLRDENMRNLDRMQSGLIEDSRIISDQLYTGHVVPPINTRTSEYYEKLQINALNPGDAIWDDILGGLNTRGNGLYKMVITGTRGKLPLFKNILGTIGQIDINGGRPIDKFDGRCSMLGPCDSNDPRDRGYIANNYLRGITPRELFLASWENRIALIAKALATSVAGTYNRTSSRRIENLTIDNLRKVMDGYKMIQPLYNAIGSDPKYLEKVKMPTVTMKWAEFEKLRMGDSKPNPEFDQLSRDREIYYEIFSVFETFEDKALDATIIAPFNVVRIMEDVVREVGTTTELNQEEALADISELIRNLPYCLMNCKQRIMQGAIPEVYDVNLLLMRMYIRSHLNIRTLINRGIGNNALKIIIRTIEDDYTRSLVEYGKMTGILSSQCMSEPLTQQVLDAHHAVGAGGGSERKKGLSRIGQILKVKDTADEPDVSMIIQLREPHCFDRASNERFASHIETLRVNMFVINTAILYENIDRLVHPSYLKDREMIAEYFKYNQRGRVSITNWCIRYEFNKSKIIEKGIKLADIYAAIMELAGVYVVNNDENSENIVMRVYLQNSLFKADLMNLEIVRKLDEEIQSTIIQGVSGINNARVVEKTITQFVKGDFVTRPCYFIVTAGSNMADIMCYPAVNTETLQTDNIYEMHKIYGITCSRLKIQMELQIQIPSFIPTHHSIYALVMTYRGLTSMDRHGSIKSGADPITRIADSSPISNMTDAATNCETDNMTGPVSRLIFGLPLKLGDSYNRIMLDLEFVANNSASKINADQLLNSL